MRVVFKQSGGLAYLPALSKPVEFDASALTAGELAELARLVDAARFFELPGSIGTPKRGAADYQTEHLTIDQDGRCNTVHILVPPEDPQLCALMAFVQKVAARVRASGRGAQDSPPASGRPR